MEERPCLLTIVTLVHIVVGVENHPLRDKLPEVFFTRRLNIHQGRKTVWLVFLRGDLDGANEDRMRKFVPNPLHARRGSTV